MMIAFASIARAATPTPVAPVQLTLENLSSVISRTDRSSAARKLKTAYDLFQAGKFSQARAIAGTLSDSKDFGDYSHWLTAAALRGEAEATLRARKSNAALEAARGARRATLEIEADFPGSPFIKQLPRDLGLSELILADAEALAGKSRFPKALEYYERAFHRLSTSNSLSRVRAESLERFGRACSQARDKARKSSKTARAECEGWVTRFLALYPSGSTELKAIAQVFLAAPDGESATISASNPKLTQTYRAPDLDQVAIDAAFEDFRKENYGNARDAFRKFLADFPRSAHRFRAQYWLAESLKRKGGRSGQDEARGLLEGLMSDAPLSYYAVLASFSTGRSIDSTIQKSLPPIADSDPSLGGSEQRRVRRTRAFIAERAYELVGLELRDLRIGNALSNEFLMFLAAINFESRNYSNAFFLITELIQRGYRGIFTEYGVRMVFPVVHWDLVKKCAADARLDPVLVLSLMKQESAFDSGAVSTAGAMGLMQLMPATAVLTDGKITRAELVEIEPNIRTGTRYLGKLLERFDGNIALALAGYNAGPNVAERWYRALPEGKGVLEFIESIPYKETREYVSTIIRNYYWYSKTLSKDPAVPLEFFWKPLESRKDKAKEASRIRRRSESA